MKAYLAGPDIFMSSASEIIEDKEYLCRQYDIEPLSPLDLELENNGKPQDIFDQNNNLIKRADICIANLTPFRGPSADAGTIWEVGACYALGKPIYGYTLMFEGYLKRLQWRYCLGDSKTDSLGCSIEDFNLIDNLMIPCSLTKTIARQSENRLYDRDIFIEVLEEIKKEQ